MGIALDIANEYDRLADVIVGTAEGYHRDPSLVEIVNGKQQRTFEQSGHPTEEQLLPKINPSYDWIRLAQRVPVRVELGELPEGVDLVVGTTGSVLVMSGTVDDPAPEGVPPVPWLLH